MGIKNEDTQSHKIFQRRNPNISTVVTSSAQNWPRQSHNKPVACSVVTGAYEVFTNESQTFHFNKYI